MPRTTIKFHEREEMRPVISKATPLGALPTDAIVSIGPVNIVGSAAALRTLAYALAKAAEMAEDYDADPEAWNERERAERDAHR